MDFARAAATLLRPALMAALAFLACSGSDGTNPANDDGNAEVPVIIAPDYGFRDTGARDTGADPVTPADGTADGDAAGLDTNPGDTGGEDPGAWDPGPDLGGGDTGGTDPGCQKDCAGKECGSDGCGGTCGKCPTSYSCVVGECLCSPDCGQNACGGDNGCGESCGDCPGSFCVEGEYPGNHCALKGPCKTSAIRTLSCTDESAAVDASTTGSSSNNGDLLDAWPSACDSVHAAGPERVFKFVADQSGSVTFTLSGQPAAMDLYLLEGSCSADSCTRRSHDSIQLAATQGTTYWVVVDATVNNTFSASLVIDCSWYVPTADP